MEPQPSYEAVPVAEAAGGVGMWQIAIGAAVVAFAACLALRPPRSRRGLLFAAGLVAAFVPVVLGHVAMLVLQVRALGEARGAAPADAQRELVRGMESASVHTWVGWTASAAAFGAMLLARRRFPRG